MTSVNPVEAPLPRADALPPDVRELYPFRGNTLDVGASSEGARPSILHYLDEFEPPPGGGSGGEGDPAPDRGPAPAPEAVLMLHGNPSWSFYYRGLVGALRDRFRCVVPDHIGCGLSDKPQDWTYRLADHIDNVERLVDHLGLARFHLVVHDWGGAIGFGLAARDPSRVGKIVVTNTAAFRSAQMPWQLHLCRVPGVGALLIRGGNAFAGLATRMAVARRKMAPAARRGYLFPYRSWHDRIATHRFVLDIPMSPRHPSYSELLRTEAALPALRAGGEHPLMIAWGGRDFVFTGHFRQGWEERFPEAAVHRFDDAGHYLLEDAGEEVAPLVREFLGGPAASS